jgi:imidazolonepropionase-like amidohydrolase
MMRVRPALLAALLGLALPFAAAAAGQRALVGGLLLDGSGGPPLPSSVILIDDDRITAIGQVGTLAVPATAEVVSTAGLTVLPGLWDLGVRLARLGHGDPQYWDDTYLPLAERVVMPAAAHQLLLAGVTSVRDIGAPLEATLAVRERIRAQRIPGPTLYGCGPALGKDVPPSAHADRWGVSDLAAARQKAEELVRAGVDCIVVAGAADFSGAELAAIAQVARDGGVRWFAEVHHDADIAPALGAGATGLIGFGTDLAPALPEAATLALGERAARGDPVPWTTGLSALTNYEWLLTNPTPLDDPRWRDGLPAIVADDIRGSLGHLAELRAYETPALRRLVVGARLRSARAAGARLLVGSDAGLPAHLAVRATWQEIELLVLEAGLAPGEAIRAATLDAAMLLGVEHDSGSITPGKYADIIAVRGDVLRHIERLQDVELVLRHGLRYR